MALEWDYTDSVVFDDSVVFGRGYDFFGLSYMRQEAAGPNGNYLIWPNGPKRDRWSLYRDTDGALSFELFSSEQAVKEEAEIWCEDKLNAQA